MPFVEVNFYFFGFQFLLRDDRGHHLEDPGSIWDGEIGAVPGHVR